jgi:hypothetical protein
MLIFLAFSYVFYNFFFTFVLMKGKLFAQAGNDTAQYGKMGAPATGSCRQLRTLWTRCRDAHRADFI